MGLPPLKVAVLHYQPNNEPVDPVVTHISESLKALGHDAVSIGVHDRVFDILTAIEQAKSDLVFNVCETFADDYRMEVNVAALMEMAGKVHRVGHGGLAVGAGQNLDQAASPVPRGEDTQLRDF